jgi:hypothetical protein
MKMTLQAALQSLDPQNDNHWTAEGAPRLDTVKFLTGESFTREAVNAAAPGFSRATATQPAGPSQAPEGMGGTGEPANAAPVAVQAPSQGDGNGTQGGDSVVGDDDADEEGAPVAEDEQTPEGRLAASERVLDAARARKAQADRDFTAAREAHDRAVQEVEQSRKSAPVGSAVAEYHASQRRLLAERASRIEALKGIDLKSILPTKAPIDAAFARRRGGPKKF